jgi:tetratricopeptide (TPR) repeat protein
MKKPRSDQDLPPERTAPPFSSRWQRTRARLAAYRLRDAWWFLLDSWEASRAFRRTVFALLAAAVVVLVLVCWVRPRWAERNAIKIAREWVASGHYNYALDAVKTALEIAPANPEAWQIAADLARLAGQKEKAVAYAHQAANLAPGKPDLVLGWAAEALRADLPEETERALAKLSADQLAGSAHAQRLLGEVARRGGRLTAAKEHFTAALRLDGPVAVDEVPLGLILLDATDTAQRQRGLALLARWTADPGWGATSLRLLLADARDRGDRAGMRKFAEALRVHPGCTLGDMPTCLLALAQSDEAQYGRVLAALEMDHAVNPKAALQLLSWLNQIGRGADAVGWMQTLPAAAMRRPPLVVAAAEALRQAADWPALRAWTEAGDWGPEVEFLRWTYGLKAAKMLGDEVQSSELTRTLYSHAQLNSAHALFAAANLYSWGLTAEAVALWWRAAEQEGKIAIDALGSLARHYQVQRDAEGQYRVFRQLHLLQPQNPAIGNNFAFFAALTGREQRRAEQAARENLAREPNNVLYLATGSFVLLVQGQTDAAERMLRPHAAEAPNSPALAFAYGLALAGSGQKAEARALLGKIPPASLTLREVELIKAALAD